MNFAPTWNEVYRQVGEWFWDQEIFDYVYERLESLKRPDMRILKKASDRKKAGMKLMSWQQLIDDYCDDEIGLAVRSLLNDSSYRSNTERAIRFIEQTGADRATFYRRMKEIKSYCPSEKIERIVLSRTAPPISTPEPPVPRPLTPRTTTMRIVR